MDGVYCLKSAIGEEEPGIVLPINLFQAPGPIYWGISLYRPEKPDNGAEPLASLSISMISSSVGRFSGISVLVWPTFNPSRGTKITSPGHF